MVGADAERDSVRGQMTETQRGIQLLEGDRHAHDAACQASIRTNRETILQLRGESKRLYRELAEVKAGDEQVIKEAFHDRGIEKNVYRNMSVKEAQAALDRRVLSNIKRLNALKYVTRTYQQHLQELNEEYERMTSEGSSDAEATSLRALENSLVKMRIKCDGAQNIMTNYLKIRSHLKEERMTFQGQLDSLEAEILKQKEELGRLQAMNNDAQHKTQLEQRDKLLYEEPTGRKSVIGSSRRKEEEAEQVDGEMLATRQRLEKKKVMNETVLQQLNEQVELLSQQFQHVKRSREATLSRDQLQAHQQRCDAAKERLRWLVRTLSAARATVGRLAGRLHHITLSDDAAAAASPDSDEFVVKLVTQCEVKLQLLCEEVQGKGLAAFCVRIEGEPSTSNTPSNSHKLPEDQRPDLFDKGGIAADTVSPEASLSVSADG